MAQFLFQKALLACTCFGSAAAQLHAQHVASLPFDDVFDIPIMLPESDEIVMADPEEGEQSSQPFFSSGANIASSKFRKGPFERSFEMPIMWPTRATSNHDAPPPTDNQLSQADDEGNHQLEYLKIVTCVTTFVGIIVWRWQRSNRVDLSAGLLEKDEQRIETELGDCGIDSQSKKSTVQFDVIDELAFESMD